MQSYLVSLSEIKNGASNTVLKVKPFTIDATNCQSVVSADGDYQGADQLNVNWTKGNLLMG